MNKALGKFEKMIKTGLSSTSTSIDGIGYTKFQNMDSSPSGFLVRPVIDEIGERKKFDEENEFYVCIDPCDLITQDDFPNLRRRRGAPIYDFVDCDEDNMASRSDINSEFDDSSEALIKPRLRSSSTCVEMISPSDTFFPEISFGASWEENSKFSGDKDDPKGPREYRWSKRGEKDDPSKSCSSSSLPSRGSSGSIWDYFTSGSGPSFQIGPNCMP